MSLWKPQTVANVIANNEGPVWNALDASPGCTVEDIMTATGQSALIVSTVLALFVDQRLAVTADGLYWLAADWCDAIKINVPLARDWFATNDGGEVSELATALGIRATLATKVCAYLKAAGAMVEK